MSNKEIADQHVELVDAFADKYGIDKCVARTAGVIIAMAVMDLTDKLDVLFYDGSKVENVASCSVELLLLHCNIISRVVKKES